MKRNIPKRSDSKIDFSAYRDQVLSVNKLNNLRFNNQHFSVIDNGTGKFVSLASRRDFITEEDFMISAVASDETTVTLTILGGTITIGITEIVAGDTQVVISTNIAYVGWEYSYEANTLTIKNFGDTWATDDAYIRKCLYVFETTGSDTLPHLTRKKTPSMIFPANFSV